MSTPKRKRQPVKYVEDDDADDDADDDSAAATDDDDDVDDDDSADDDNDSSPSEEEPEFKASKLHETTEKLKAEFSPHKISNDQLRKSLHEVLSSVDFETITRRQIVEVGAGDLRRPLLMFALLAEIGESDGCGIVEGQEALHKRRDPEVFRRSFRKSAFKHSG
jgi:hypothetical protein